MGDAAPASGASSEIPGKRVRLEDVAHDPTVIAYIEVADEYLGAIGYTEHGFRHANLVAHIAGSILRRLDYDERTVELGEMAGFMHDIGNCVGRELHSASSALLARGVLGDLGVDPREIAQVMNAMGNHEEEFGVPANPIGAATIIADKSDVHRTRVRNQSPQTFDIHDRVNSAAERSFVRVSDDDKTVTLELTIDTEQASVADYFNIFLPRMMFIKRSCDLLAVQFRLEINQTRMI